MDEAQLPGMQSLPVYQLQQTSRLSHVSSGHAAVAPSPSSIDRVAEDRVPNVSQMHPDLVSPPGLEVEHKM
jgi:hypothetical protein